MAVDTLLQYHRAAPWSVQCDFLENAHPVALMLVDTSPCNISVVQHEAVKQAEGLQGSGVTVLLYNSMVVNTP